MAQTAQSKAAIVSVASMAVYDWFVKEDQTRLAPALQRASESGEATLNSVRLVTYQHDG